MPNLEEYKIQNNEIQLSFGYFKDLVFHKHIKSYGDAAAKKMLSKATTILSESLEIINDPLKVKNVLLVGKIQSGKTSNLEILSALAFDSGFKVLIIFGGYDTFLVNQSYKRFNKTFKSVDEEFEDRDPIVISSEDNLYEFDKHFFVEKMEEGKPIIIDVMKRSDSLQKLNALIDKIKDLELPTLIIDDEGDQASLNTEFKKDKISTTYECICELKNKLKNHVYYSVTATPQAVIFQPNFSALKPVKIYLFTPGEGYYGGDMFHLLDNNIILTKDDDNDKLMEGTKLPDSMINALSHFFIASAIMKKRNIKYSDMIIHTFRNVKPQDIVFNNVYNYLNSLKQFAYAKGVVYDYIIKQIKKIYNTDYFPEDIINSNLWDDEFENNILKVICGTHIEVWNSTNNIRPSNDDGSKRKFNHVIYIGGDLLQRGITFDYLVTTYFTRWAENGNMDTSLQRARWFGYRGKFFDLCRVFMTNKIKCEFANLACIENDLWDQFMMVENGSLDLNDIIIDASNTSLKPTRSNVVDLVNIKFSTKWNNQRIITFDKNQIDNNNNLLEGLLKGREFSKTTIGRNDNKASAYFTYVSGNDFANFVEKTDVIFDNIPLLKNDIKRTFENENICIEIMFGGEMPQYRKRSFNDNKVSALQQGADKVDKDERKYLGDSSVIQDEKTICVQIFNVVPKIGDTKELDIDKKQYMYSIHFPVERKGYKGR